eukprot:4667998-Prymnesium_polylepis.2
MRPPRQTRARRQSSPAEWAAEASHASQQPRLALARRRRRCARRRLPACAHHPAWSWPPRAWLMAWSARVRALAGTRGRACRRRCLLSTPALRARPRRRTSAAANRSAAAAPSLSAAASSTSARAAPRAERRSSATRLCCTGAAPVGRRG